MREIERRLGVADRLAACLNERRAPERVHHRLAEIIRFRMLMIAAGYEDGNDADALRRDPMFKLALPRRGPRPNTRPDRWNTRRFTRVLRHWTQIADGGRPR